MAPDQLPVSGRLGDLFSVLAYDEHGGLFLTSDPALGFGFLCRPAVAAGSVQDGLTVLLNLPWPTATLVQFCLWTSPMIEPLLAEYQRLRLGQRAPLLQQAVAAQLDFFRAGVDRPLEPRSGVQVRDLVLIVTVKLPLGGQAPSEQERQLAGTLRVSASQCLETGGLLPRPLGAEGLLRVLGSLLNSAPTATWRDPSPLWDCHQLLNRQLADTHTDLRVDRHGLWLGDRRVNLLSIKRLPTEAVLGGALRYLGDPLSGRRGIREPLLISATVYFPDASGSHSRLEAARTWLTNQADSGLARFAPVLAARKGEYDYLLAAVDNGNRVVQLDLGVALFTAASAATAAVTNLQTFYRTSGLQMMPDEFISLPLFLNRLPFGAEARAVRALQRARTLAVPDVVPLLPVFGDWPGTGTPTLLLVSRQGQLVTLCPFDSPSNFNGVIAAAPGKGKSFLANALVSGLLSRGGRVWVLDVGRSYQKMAEALGGQVLAFTPDAQVGLNPFPLVGDWDEEADVIAGLLTAMAAPSEPLENLQAAELKRVLRTVWDQYGRSATVSRVAAALLTQPDRRVKDLGRQLYSFTDEGEYGAFFSGANSLRVDQPFLVVELEELKGRRHLQQVVLLTILYQIQQQLYLNQAERERPKLVLIDEAWEYLAGGNILDFLVATYRRVRKYGGACWIITQSLTDLYASGGGVTIAENSAHKWVLGQNPETVAALEKEGRLALGPGGYALLRSIHTEPGAYAEVFCVSDGRGAGVARLIVPPYERLLYSTRADEVAAIQRLRDRGLSLAAAIEMLLQAGEAA